MLMSDQAQILNPTEVYREPPLRRLVMSPNPRMATLRRSDELFCRDVESDLKQPAGWSVIRPRSMVPRGIVDHVRYKGCFASDLRWPAIVVVIPSLEHAIYHVLFTLYWPYSESLDLRRRSPW